MPNFLQTQIVGGDQVQLTSPAQIPCMIGPAPTPAVGSVFTFNPGDQVVNVLGFGLLADVILYLLRDTAQPVNCAISDASGGGWSPAPTFTHVGTGPSITTALGVGIPGCLDDHNFLLTCTNGGPLGTATFSLAYDGGTGVENFVAPVQGPATLLGSNPITPSVLAKLNGLTLVLAAPSAGTVTYAAGSLAAAPAGLEAATATSTSPVNILPASLIAAGLTALAANPRRISLTTAGGTPANATGAYTITGTDYTGATITEVLAPATTASTVFSVNVYATITSFAVAANAGTGATVSIGYSDAFATVAEFITATNTALTGIPEAVTAIGAQAAAGTFLQLSTTAVGTGATLTFNAAAGTAAATLGFSNNQTATGTNATRALPKAGLVLTFASGTYVAKDTYAALVTGPRSTIAQRTAAALAARNAYNTNPFGFFADAMPTDTAANCAALVAAYETNRLTWLNDPNQPRDVYFLTASPWHVASPVSVTNQGNITTNDSALLGAGFSVCPESVIVDDVYLPGAANCVSGKFRRAASVGAACMRAKAPRVAATMSEGNLPEASLVAGDGLTLARDENTAVRSLSGMAGPGFFVLQTASDGKSATFALGATLAGATSRLRSDGDFAVACEAARLCQTVVLNWKAQRPDTDTTTGMMLDDQKSSRHDQIDNVLQPFLRPLQGLPNCSGYTILISDPPTGKFTDNGITPVTVTISELGTIQQVVLTIAMSGTTITVSS